MRAVMNTTGIVDLKISYQQWYFNFMIFFLIHLYSLKIVKNYNLSIFANSFVRYSRPWMKAKDQFKILSQPFNLLLVATPLEASTGTWFLLLIIKQKNCGGYFFLGAISLGRVVVPSPKIVINLPRCYPLKENQIG